MQDLSLHLLDIAENGVRAGAKRIEIGIQEDTAGGRLVLRVTDDGRGMDPEMARAVVDPFVTTRTERRVGLGVPMLARSARETGGDVEVVSAKGKGTTIRAWFDSGHIDCRPLGDVVETVLTLVLGNPGIDFVLDWTRDGRKVELDTREIREQLGDIPITETAVMAMLREKLREEVKALRS